MKLEGYLTIEAYENGELLYRKKVKNLLTEISRQSRTDMLLGTYAGGADALQIHYFAFGIGTTAPTVNDTQLEDEQFRKQVTSISSPSAGVVQSICSLGSGDANFTITEIGIFCGSSASATPNSGTLLARVLVNIPKNSNITLNIIRSDICTLN